MVAKRYQEKKTDKKKRGKGDQKGKMETLKTRKQIQKDEENRRKRRKLRGKDKTVSEKDRILGTAISS